LISQSIAQVSIPDQQVEKEMMFQLKFMKLMLQVGADIDSEVGSDQKIFNQPAKMTELLKKKLVVYHQFFESSLQIPEAKKSEFKKYFLALKWENIVSVFKKSHMGMEVFFKKKGPGVAIAIMLGFVCKFTIPVILSSMGLGHIIPYVILLPYPILFSFIPGQLNKLKVKKALIDDLGGKAQTDAYFQQQAMTLKAMHSKSPNDFLIPISETNDLTESAVLERSSIKNGLLEKLGFHKDNLNLKSIKKFISDYNASDDYIEWVTTTKTLDNDLKAILLTSHIFSIGDKDLESIFKKQFSTNITILRKSSHWDSILDWTQDIVKARDFEEMLAKLEQAPQEMTPKELAIIWEEMLLPEFVVNFHMDYSAERAMYADFDVLKAKLNLSSSQSFDLKTRNEIFTYLKKAKGGNHFGGCSNSPAKIAQYLLKGL
jgi:hypothetical protein